MIGYVIRGEIESKRWYNGYMSMKEAAVYLKISTSTLRKMIKENKIPYSRHSYGNSSANFHRTILDAWLKDEFPPGRVELMLNEERIDWDHRDALREHSERLLGLVPKLETVQERAAINYRKSIRLSTIPMQRKLEIEEYCSGLSVSEKLSSPHQLVRETMQYKNARKETTRPTSTNFLNVNTSNEQFERALIIFDTVLKAFERLGGVIKNKHKETRVCIGSEEVKIGIKEKRKQVRHEKTKNELDKEARSGYSWAPSFDYVQTGNLQFFIDEWYAPRKNWNDTVNKKIEHSIIDIIMTIFETAECLRLIRLEREEDENKRREVELDRRKLQKQREDEHLKIIELEDRAKDYQISKSIREYVHALIIRKESTVDSRESEEFECYINWAQQKADWFDPLVNREDPLLGRRRDNRDRKMELN
ncbi:excisionase family DNA-binding protein [Paenibacillus sp. PAMC21692]|uniref:excisionase family DNA-binding protein n=1 Tax=Paenibacillus sp. PAMC21692 TaxID=2762320 RepID=UPI00164D2D3F|nr:helix-turn-helix domain-containing protein [Paenibacillus sp. PAMC21692]QNK57418.1 helix-turn-helix domain-containing protein [Paenibacillus sp. PAMC21692]